MKFLLSCWTQCLLIYTGGFILILSFTSACTIGLPFTSFLWFCPTLLFFSFWALLWLSLTASRRDQLPLVSLPLLLPSLYPSSSTPRPIATLYSFISFNFLQIRIVLCCCTSKHCLSPRTSTTSSFLLSLSCLHDSQTHAFALSAPSWLIF